MLGAQEEGPRAGPFSGLHLVAGSGGAQLQVGVAHMLDQFLRLLLGAGVSRLTTMITAKPTGTPNTPAEIGWMPHHRSHRRW